MVQPSAFILLLSSLLSYLYLYYWFGVGEATLQIHHLNSQFTPARPDILQALPPPSYKLFKEKEKEI
jgi:hypothetical protein